jgi:hypothetical protein
MCTQNTHETKFISIFGKKIMKQWVWKQVFLIPTIGEEPRIFLCPEKGKLYFQKPECAKQTK